MNICILGASEKPHRFSNKVLKILKSKHYTIFPIHPIHKVIEDIPVIKSISEITIPVHTLTIYVNSTVSTPLEKDILNMNPKRVIFNPGAENESLRNNLEKNGISTLNACSYVMLNTGQF